MSKCPLSGKPCDKAKLIHVTELNKGESKNFSLCHDCLEAYKNGEKFEEEPVQEPVQEPEANSLIDDLIKKLTGQKPLLDSQEVSNLPPCPKCNATYEKIIKAQRVGCDKCYDHFGQNIISVIQNVQGSLEHKGKAPKGNNMKKNAKAETAKRTNSAIFRSNLDTKMNKAIELEDYEKCAILRDTTNTFDEIRKRLEESIDNENYEDAQSIREELQEFMTSYERAQKEAEDQ